MQSDLLEGEFGAIRQMSGGYYLISVDQVISSLSLRRLKLYSKLGLENVVDTNKNECCEGNLDDRDEDLELLDSCFNYASDLSEDEKASPYDISGYVAFKESLTDAGEFTEMIFRDKLTHPLSTLYDLSQNLYSFSSIVK